MGEEEVSRLTEQQRVTEQSNRDEIEKLKLDIENEKTLVN